MLAVRITSVPFELKQTPAAYIGRYVLATTPTHPALVVKSITFNVVYLAQNEANYEDLFFLKNKMIQQSSWQAIYMCIFIVKAHQCNLVINFRQNA